MSLVREVLLTKYINNSWSNWEIASYKLKKANNKNDIIIGDTNANIIKGWKRKIEINYK